ncbi:Glycosyltransferase, GT2 family [Sinosporangium album]|uniref:Glycosyltransferase, GT2 family n=1 Tax=Sinosporangium album TaxID=504805 RepID=A0A1G7V1U5_9ACTN|nr:glycosyltransferase [Sinosporangium album]SDG53753.1 Glycosyltransferase, GT2 family [Sinosporangium album]
MTGGVSTPTSPSSPPYEPRDRPLIKHNDYSPLSPPAIGARTPSRTVSVVIPAHSGQNRLDTTLAALTAQTYPAHLMEVIVVDDGSTPPLRLPEIRPEGTRIVAAENGGWGIAHAVNTGVRAADGELIQRLDADMVICREHIEALARWHHETDYLVTIGMKSFTNAMPPSPEDVHDAVSMGTLSTLFPADTLVPSSTTATIARLDGLRASRNPYHVCTGPTVSLRKDVFEAVGGLDPRVLRGEDTEFAYRLAMHGVVFVPDEAAEAVHLGLPAQRLAPERAVRAVEPYLAHRVPLRRDLRKAPGRRWLVPYVEIVFEVGDAAEDTVREAVGAALTGSLQDVVVTLVAPWSALPEGRRPVLTDPSFDLHVMREHFAHDERVRLRDEAAPTPAPVPYRYVGPLDVPPAAGTLEKMIATVQKERPGVLVVDLPDGRTARLERTEALGRALLLAGPGRDRHEVIRATHGVRHGAMQDYWPARASTPAAPATAAPTSEASTTGGRGGSVGSAPSAAPDTAAPASRSAPQSAPRRTGSSTPASSRSGGWLDRAREAMRRL